MSGNSSTTPPTGDLHASGSLCGSSVPTNPRPFRDRGSASARRLPVGTLVADGDGWKWKRGVEVEVEVDVLGVGPEVDDPLSDEPQQQRTGRQECQQPRHSTASVQPIHLHVHHSWNWVTGSTGHRSTIWPGRVGSGHRLMVRPVA